MILPLLQGGDLLEWLCIRMQYQSHLFCNIPQYPPAFLKYPRLRLQAWREAGEVEKFDCRLSAMDFLLKQDAFFPLTEEINVLLFTSPSPDDALWRLLLRPLINRILHRTTQSKRLHKSHERRSQVISTSWDSCVKVSVWEAAAALSVNRRPSDTRAYYASPLQPYQ